MWRHKLGTFLSSGCFLWQRVILAFDNVSLREKLPPTPGVFLVLGETQYFCKKTNVAHERTTCYRLPCRVPVKVARHLPPKRKRRIASRYMYVIVNQQMYVARPNTSCINLKNCANQPPSGKFWQLLVKPTADTPPRKICRNSWV